MIFSSVLMDVRKRQHFNPSMGQASSARCSATCLYSDLMHPCYSQKGPPLSSDCHLSYLTNLLMLMFICTGRSFVVFLLQYGFFVSCKCNKLGKGSVLSLMSWRGSHGTLINAFENSPLLWSVWLLIKSPVWSKLAYSLRRVRFSYTNDCWMTVLPLAEEQFLKHESWCYFALLWQVHSAHAQTWQHPPMLMLTCWLVPDCSWAWLLQRKLFPRREIAARHPRKSPEETSCWPPIRIVQGLLLSLRAQS